MKINKVCLTAVNSKYIHSSLAVLSIAKMYELYSQKSEIKMPELIVKEESINNNFDAVIYGVMSSNADVYAFSVYIWNVDIVLRLCRRIKASKPESIIILGGPEVSYGMEHTKYTYHDYDYIICGEGERAFFSVISEICGNEVPSEWNYTSDGKMRFTDYIEELSEITFPYNESNINNYSERIIYYESSRGCPYSCAYCLSSVCGKVRELPLERVFGDIDFFIENNVKQVKFVDRTFNCNHDKAYAIWKHIIDRQENCSTNFHFEIGGDLITNEQLELLRQAKNGLIQLEMGIQSTNEQALGECCRKTDISKLFSNINELIESGNINIHVDLIAGLPFENYDEFALSFNDAYALNAHQLQLGFLKLLSGAPLNNMIKKHGYVFSDSAPYEVILNKYISYCDLMKLKRIEDVLERYYNSGKFVGTLKKSVPEFASPFVFFEKLSDWFVTNEMIFTGVSSREVYNAISVFLKSNGINADRELLLDFYTSDKSDVVPSELKYLVTDRKSAMKKIIQQGNKKAQMRLIENTVYLIDYSHRCPVTSVYEIVEVIENVCL